MRQSVSKFVDHSSCFVRKNVSCRYHSLPDSLRTENTLVDLACTRTLSKHPERIATKSSPRYLGNGILFEG